METKYEVNIHSLAIPTKSAMLKGNSSEPEMQFRK